jgi:hypothetical protein
MELLNVEVEDSKLKDNIKLFEENIMQRISKLKDFTLENYIVKAFTSFTLLLNKAIIKFVYISLK